TMCIVSDTGGPVHASAVPAHRELRSGPISPAHRLDLDLFHPLARASGARSHRRCRHQLAGRRKCGPPTLIFQYVRGDTMKATQKLHELGQSLWLDNITRDLLTKGVLKDYVKELSVTGLTSNPTIFDHAIKNSTAYDAAIRQKLKEGKSGEGLF